MTSKPITEEIRKSLNMIDNTASLQSERGANDIRRRNIKLELENIERLVSELGRRNKEDK